VGFVVAHGLLNAWELAYGGSPISEALQRIYNGLLIILVAYVAWRVLFGIVLVYLTPTLQEADGQAGRIIIPVLSRIGPVIIVIAVANAVVSTLGGNLGTLLAGLGLLGLDDVAQAVPAQPAADNGAAHRDRSLEQRLMWLQ
jgi:small-conductance mechanosensitive channel